MLQKAIEIAVKAHGDQLDKAGKLYILHPLRVMLRGQNEEEQILGVLHDTVEDTDLTIEDLRNEGFSEVILDALICISKQPGEDYGHFIDRVMSNSLATRVKLYDIEDNMNRERIPSPTKEDEERFAKYANFHTLVKHKADEYRKRELT